MTRWVSATLLVQGHLPDGTPGGEGVKTSFQGGHGRGKAGWRRRPDSFEPHLARAASSAGSTAQAGERMRSLRSYRTDGLRPCHRMGSFGIRRLPFVPRSNHCGILREGSRRVLRSERPFRTHTA